MFGVLGGTLGDFAEVQCQDYCVWVVGINIGTTVRVCNPATGVGVGV